MQFIAVGDIKIGLKGKIGSIRRINESHKSLLNRFLSYEYFTIVLPIREQIGRDHLICLRI